MSDHGPIYNASLLAGSNQGQGVRPELFLNPVAAQAPPGIIGETQQKVAQAALAREDEIPWHDYLEVLPIAYQPDRIWVSQNNSAVCRIGEIWARVKGLGLRFQSSIWQNRANGNVWLLEQEITYKKKNGDILRYSAIHWDAQAHRRGVNHWLCVVWQNAYVASGGNLPYTKGNASSASFYFPVGADGEIRARPNRFTGELELPWSRWETRGDADARRRFGAVPQCMGEPDAPLDGAEPAGGEGGGCREAGRDVPCGGDDQPRDGDGDGQA